MRSEGGPDREPSAGQRVSVLLDLGRPEEALRFLATQPPDAGMLRLTSRCHLALGDLANAQKSAERAIAAEPHNEWAYRLRCLALRYQGRLEEALESARQAVGLDPHEPQALYQLGDLLVVLKSFKEARKVADELLALAPSWPLSHVLASRVANGQKRWYDGERHARQALALDPDDVEAAGCLARALSRPFDLGGGKKREAIEVLYAAFARNPQHGRIRRRLMDLVDDRFHVPLTLYLVLGIVLPGLYLWALFELVWRVVLAPLHLRRYTPGARELVRQRIRAKRRRVGWQILLVISLPVVLGMWLYALADPAFEPGLRFGTILAGFSILLGLSLWRLYRPAARDRAVLGHR